MADRRTSASQSSEQYCEEDMDRVEFAGEAEASSQRLLLLGSSDKPNAMKAVQTWLDRSPPPHEQAMSSPLAGEDYEEEGQEKKAISSAAGGGRDCLNKVHVTGSCLCKLSIVIYLLACVLVSALYVAIYGPSELYTSPEVGSPHPAGHPAATPHIPQLQFYDRPYTEWISQRWTYSQTSFADWPILPVNISSIEQITAGQVNGNPVVWLLSSDGLHCAEGLGGEQVTFRNISSSLELSVPEGSVMAAHPGDHLWLITTENITLLDCSPAARDYCDIAVQWPPLPENITILSATVSLSDSHLWMGTTSGLFRLDPSRKREEKEGEEEEEILRKEEEEEQKENWKSELEGKEEEEDDESGATPLMGVVGTVLGVAWRSELRGPNGWSLGSHAFLLTNSSYQLPQDVSYSSGSGIHCAKNTPAGFGLLVVATKERLYFHDGTTWWFEWVSVWGAGLGGVVDSPPTALSFTSSGDLYIGSNSSISRLHINYTFSRLGPLQGLPSRPITALHYSPFVPEYPLPTEKPSTKHPQQSSPASHGGVMWVGTGRGYALFNINSSQFISYHYGPRWHPGEEVRGVAAAGSNTTLLLTDRGIAVVWPEQWTLARKAAHYQSMLQRHQRDPGQ